MFARFAAAAETAFAILLTSVALLSQQVSAPQHCVGCEFPIVMRQSVTAGRTKVGTKVEAKLVVATLLKGGVIPRDAVLSGEVTESVAKTDGAPSRLAIRMDSAEWKNGKATFKVYLTAWYYPPAPMAPQNLAYQPGDPQSTRKNPGGTDYTDPKNPMSQQKWPPQRDEDNGMNAAAPASAISKDRVLMKDVESAHNTDGAVVLVSAKSNIKLDKFTTYVLAAGDLLPGN
jgi:hypothetical protein